MNASLVNADLAIDHPRTSAVAVPADAARIAIRLGGTFRLPPVPQAAPAAVADTGRVRLGGTFRLPRA